MQFKSFDMRVSREIREKKGGGENGNHWVRLALEHQCQSQFSFVGWLVGISVEDTHAGRGGVDVPF